jgi:hypothetical protein
MMTCVAAIALINIVVFLFKACCGHVDPIGLYCTCTGNVVQQVSCALLQPRSTADMWYFILIMLHYYISHILVSSSTLPLNSPGNIISMHINNTCEVAG